LSGNRLNLMVFHSEGEDTVFRETLEKAMQGAEGRVYAGIGRAVEDITKAGASNISAVRAAGYMIYEVPGTFTTTAWSAGRNRRFPRRQSGLIPCWRQSKMRIFRPSPHTAISLCRA